MRPLIGITCETGFNAKNLAEYSLRHNYCDNLVKCGATPLLLPHDEASAANYIKILDGILISGGNLDVDPKLYGKTDLHPKTQPDTARNTFESTLAREALAKETPILGICGGAQLLAVTLGGNLYQHIGDQAENPLEHEQPIPLNEPYHEIAIREGSLLAKVTERKKMKVNSAHHQGIKSAGRGKVSAVAEDSIPEAIEYGDKFCLGVQWHPEYNTDAADEKIFAAFVTACR